MLAEYAFQSPGVVMERKAYVLHQPLVTLAPDEIPAADTVHQGRIVLVHRVEQIPVEISGSGALELGVENTLHVFGPPYLPAGKLVRDRETLTRVTPDDQLPENLLAVSQMILPCGVEVCESTVKKEIHHPGGLLHVHRTQIVAVLERKPHHPESELLHRDTLP